jgi:hypothetical protein
MHPSSIYTSSMMARKKLCTLSSPLLVYLSIFIPNLNYFSSQILAVHTLNPKVPDRTVRKQNILNWVVASISRIQSAFNINMDIISVSYRRSQVLVPSNRHNTCLILTFTILAHRRCRLWPEYLSVLSPFLAQTFDNAVLFLYCTISMYVLPQVYLTCKCEISECVLL